MTPSSPWVRSIPYGTSEQTSIVLDRASHDDLRAWDLEACSTIRDWAVDVTMSCTELERNRVADDVVPNHLGIFVVSERVRTLLLEIDKGGAAVQFLPVRLDYRGKDIGDFYVLNLLNAVSALDRARSKVDVYTSLDVSQQPIGGIKAIRRAVLIEKALRGAPPLFRLAEDRRWVCFSPELRAAIVERSISGFHFVEIETS